MKKTTNCQRSTYKNRAVKDMHESNNDYIK